MRPAILPLLLALALTAIRPASAEPIDLNAKLIALDPAGPGTRKVGALVYRGGLEISSRDPRFGGLSALGVSPDGRRMVALSDRGTSLSARLLYDESGDLVGLEAPDLVPLTDTGGLPLKGKFLSDAEDLAPGVRGEIIVSFEGDHRLWAYPPGTVRAQPIRPPEGLSRLPGRFGIEALTLLADGRLLAIAEGESGRASTIAWVSSAAGWDVMTYPLEDDYRVTGATTLPLSGDVLVLERYFTARGTNRVRIRRLAAGSFEPGASLAGPVIAALAPPLAVDNFEGIEARPGDDGQVFVYLVSDDNFNAGRQRTLLLMFELRT